MNLQRSFVRIAFAVCVIGAVHSTTYVQANSARAATDGHDWQDLLYLAKDGPVFLRVHLRVDGQSYQVAWNKYVDGLFKQLDADGDGDLSGDEAERIPTYKQLSQSGFASSRNARTAATIHPDSHPRDDKVTRKELDTYLRKIGAGPFSERMQQNNSSAGVMVFGGRNNQSGNSGKELFNHFDQDNDKKLSVAEFKAAAESVRKLDIDDDETVSLDELQTSRNPYAAYVYQGQRQTASKPSPFISLAANASLSTVVEKLLEKYDDKDNGLNPEELSMSEQIFVEFDLDGNGRLDAKELRQMLNDPVPNLELIIRIGRPQRTRQRQRRIAPMVEIVSSSESNLTGFSIRKSADGTPSLVLGNVQIEFAADRNSYAASYKPFYKQQLKNADANKNGYIEKAEAQRSFYFRQSFNILDRDGDGKVFEKEVLAYVDQQQAAAAGRTVMDVEDQGRNLFEILDLNRDRRLSRRELNAAINGKEKWDDNRDGEVAADEIPKYMRLTVSRARPSIPGVNRRIRAISGVRYSPRGTTRGPVWFQKMDRNRDGDVSPREFLGKSDEFNRLDKDANGLIDETEALSAS